MRERKKKWVEEEWSWRELRTKSTDRWPLQNEGTDFWRKPTSFPSFVMPRLHSSSSPIEESCTSFPALQGIITKTTKPTFSLYKSQKGNNKTQKTKHKPFSFLFFSFKCFEFFFLLLFSVREKMKVDFIFVVLEFYPFLWNDCVLNASVLDLQLGTKRHKKTITVVLTLLSVLFLGESKDSAFIYFAFLFFAFFFEICFFSFRWS